MKPENYEEIQVLMKRREKVAEMIENFNGTFIDDVKLIFETSQRYLFRSTDFDFETMLSKALVKAAFVDTLDELNKLLERIDARLAEL